MEINEEFELLSDEREMEELKGETVKPELEIEDILNPSFILVSFQLEVVSDETPMPYDLHMNVDCALTGFEEVKPLRLLKHKDFLRVASYEPYTRDDV